MTAVWGFHTLDICDIQDIFVLYPFKYNTVIFIKVENTPFTECYVHYMGFRKSIIMGNLKHLSALNEDLTVSNLDQSLDPMVQVL